MFEIVIVMKILKIICVFIVDFLYQTSAFAWILQSFPHEMEENNFCLLKKIDCQQGAVRAVRFNADGDYVITCGSNKTIKLWTSAFSKDIGIKKLPKLLTTYAGHGNEVLDARGSCDNGQIVSCGLDKAILLWDVGSGKILR